MCTFIKCGLNSVLIPWIFFSNLHRNSAFLVNNYCFVTEFWYMYVYFNPLGDVWHRTSLLCPPPFSKVRKDTCPPLPSLVIHSQMFDTGRATCAPSQKFWGTRVPSLIPPILAGMKSIQMSDTGRVTCAPPPFLKLWEGNVRPLPHLAFNPFRDVWHIATCVPFSKVGRGTCPLLSPILAGL